MSNTARLDHRALYRLPWNASDNIISWLEPTKQCNIYCEGCYSANTKDSHKSLEKIADDLNVFERFRQTDAVSIAGGDPLTHPQIADVVRMVAKRGFKPIVNTNGVAITPQLIRDLKDAGLYGFTFHVDSLQNRPEWRGRSEAELNELRLRFARMTAEVGGIACAFNATIYDRTIADVRTILDWGRKHIDIVHTLVFILFRAAIEDGRYEYWVQNHKVDVAKTVYTRAKPQRLDITADEIIDEIRAAEPAFAPCAYLNGTEDPSAFKWLMTLRFGDPKRITGYAGPKFAELSQTLNHLRHGRYLGYVPPKVHRRARWMLPLGIFDRELRKAWKKDALRCLRNPLRLLRPLHMQSVMIIQPVDVQVDGRQSMCDGCPDMTVHDGRLVWSCRLDERLKYGDLMTLIPAERARTDAGIKIETPAGAETT